MKTEDERGIVVSQRIDGAWWWGLLVLGVLALVAIAPGREPGAPSSTPEASFDPTTHPHRGCDPRPPEVLQLAAVSGEPGTYSLTVLPAILGTARIEAIEPAALVFADGLRSESVHFDPESPALHRRLIVSDGNPPERLVVRFTALQADGVPWLSVDEELRIVERTARRRALDARRAVLLPLPDGRHAVEYMTTAEAERRGLKLAPESTATSTGGGR
ncbi:MAG: hypothetical protein AB7O52_17415 [Planctomycetota bacterium]